jgi:methyl-accepting chemotaxis protein
MRSLRFLLTCQLVVALGAALVLVISAYVAKERITAESTRAMVAKDVTADVLPPPMYLIEMRLVLSQGIEGTLAVAQVRDEFARLSREYGERVAHWRAHPPYGLERDLLGAQHVAGERFIAAAQAQVMAPLLAGDRDAAARALPQVHAAYLAHRAGVDATVRSAGRFAGESMAALAASERSGAVFMTAATAAMVALLVAFFIWLRRAVWSSVGAEPAQIAAVAQVVAQGDLTQPIATRYPDSVAGSLERMRVQMSTVVGEVRAGVESVSTASSQIAAGNSDLSSRTEQQASSLQETAASMEQITGTVKANADSARQASALATQASAVAERGGQVVGAVVSTMDEISASSRRIAEIIGVIDDIAFQTNILALNAAVEAARAGEQGRGFAVVAGEVRGLAQRSAQAAREIKALIGDSVDKVQAGSQLVDDAGATMAEIVQQVKRVTDLIGEITHATLEQSGGLAQVNEAVTQLDRTTQQNAALVEQSAAAAESLQQQAQALAGAVAVFRLNAVGASGASRTREAQPRPAAPRAPVVAARSASPARPAAGAAVQRRPAAATASAVGGDWQSF